MTMRRRSSSSSSRSIRERSVTASSAPWFVGANIFIAFLLLHPLAASAQQNSTSGTLLHPDIVTVLNVVGETPGGRSWADSYSVGDRCYCRSSFDHDVKVMVVNTPLGWRNVTEICDLLGPGPGWAGRPVYNDIQCGNGPPNNAGDEQTCPGRVDIGREGCGQIGPKWNFVDLIGVVPPSNTTPPRRADPDIVAVVPGVVGITNPSVKATPSSYSDGKNCYCLTPLDPLIQTTFVDTPKGWMTVGEVCDLIGPGPGSDGRPLYNDVQCGNGPATANNTEIRCPGRADKNRPGCAEIGPTWNFKRIRETTMAPATPIPSSQVFTAAPSSTSTTSTTTAPTPLATTITISSETPEPTTGFTLAVTARPVAAPQTQPSFSEAPPTPAPVLMITTSIPTAVGTSTSSPVAEFPVTSSEPTTVVPLSSSSPTTDVPFSFAPTTQVPASFVPTILAPTSSAPSTAAPVSFAPSTAAPVSFAPSTAAPVSLTSSTDAPVSFAPASLAPTTYAPASFAPTSDAPVSFAPTTDAPVSFAPTTNAPASFAPTTQLPVASLFPVSIPVPTVITSPAPTREDEQDIVIAPITLNFEPHGGSINIPTIQLPTDHQLIGDASSSSASTTRVYSGVTLLFATFVNFIF